MTRKYGDLTGRTFGCRVVIGIDTPPPKPRWKVQCGCGKVQTLSTSDVVRRLSCGCQSRRTHGQAGGVSSRPTREYEAWQGMKDRCYNPTADYFENYGGRGIAVCDRWRDSFENFFADMGPRPSNRHSLDRRDVNAGYEPDNCEHADPDEALTLRTWPQEVDVLRSEIDAAWKASRSAVRTMGVPLAEVVACLRERCDELANAEAGRAEAERERDQADILARVLTDDAATLRARIAGLEQTLHVVTGGATDLRVERDVFKRRVDELEALLNAPEILDFARAVQLEAAHQRQRWNDENKTDADWFWLIGYLAGKALYNPGGDVEKQLHRIVTVAAAACNWHAARLGKTNMRPGIETPASVSGPASTGGEAGDIPPPLAPASVDIHEDGGAR
jgi:hypothetical protein